VNLTTYEWGRRIVGAGERRGWYASAQGTYFQKGKLGRKDDAGKRNLETDLGGRGHAHQGVEQRNVFYRQKVTNNDGAQKRKTPEGRLRTMLPSVGKGKKRSGEVRRKRRRELVSSIYKR